MGLSDYFNGPKFKAENSKLQQEIKELKKIRSAVVAENNSLELILKENGSLDLLQVRKKIAAAENDLHSREVLINEREKTLLDLQKIIDDKKSQMLVLEESLLLESFALYLPKFEFSSSEEYKNKLEQIRNLQKQLIKNEQAATGNQSWTVGGSQAEGKKLVKDMTKLVLRAFNNECDYCVDNVKFNNIETHEKRINQSFNALNKLGEIMQVAITEKYRNSKLDELHLAYEYQIKKQDEKEEQKKIREDLREQHKLEQEIRAAREKIEKERKHFKAALKELEDRLKSAKEPDEVKMLQDKISEVQGQFSELDNEEKLIDYREQNAKAGYIYVISNIGAFGENVYKIGMTRRLEPMDRVDELGDASVPFVFDVHALIFSDNAPALESKIHEHFYNNRINKLNDRKEFFRADIDEIEQVIKNNFDKSVEINKEAPAEQYREGLLIK
jgi:hypothetical protein